MAAVFRRKVWLVAALAALVLPMSVLTTTSVASAHERRTVGKYTFVVGFLNEPALANQPNGLDLRITSSDTNEPVSGAEKTLKAEIIQGSAKKSLPVSARFGVPGGYTADVIPTKPGSYSFHFTGDINGAPIDETFESGPGRFDDVQDPAALQFPVGATAGSSADSSQVTTLVRQVATMDQAVRDAQDAASTARTVGFAGLLVGVIGIAIGAFALMRRKPEAEEGSQATSEHAA
jgi:hypothetical protein